MSRESIFLHFEICKNVTLMIKQLPFCLLTMFAINASSQSLTLSDQNGPIPSNSTIIQPGTPDSNRLLTYLNVNNISTNTIQVICKKTELSMLDSTQTFMCWAGYCFAPHLYVSPYAQPIEAGQTNHEFKGIYAQVSYNSFPIGESVVRWVFCDQSNVNDSVSVTVRYTTYPVSLDEVQKSPNGFVNCNPNPADIFTTVRFSDQIVSCGSVRIYNILGETVYEQPLPPFTSHPVRVSTMNLASGIYICSVSVNGNFIASDKLIIHH